MTSNKLPADLFGNELLHRATIGFNDFFAALDSPVFKTNGYPFYNVAVINKDTDAPTYEITMAVAGFTDKDIDVVLDGNILKITGTSTILERDCDTVHMLFRGIAGRDFERRFQVADHIEVINASLKDGILVILLEQKIPEELQPKHIAINS